MNERRLPGIPPDALTIPFAVWFARHGLQRIPDWALSKAEREALEGPKSVIQPKAKKARSGK